MLEKVDLTRAIPKEEYKTRLPALQASLYDLQLRTSEAGLPSVIVFEGASPITNWGEASFRRLEYARRIARNTGTVADGLAEMRPSISLARAGIPPPLCRLVDRVGISSRYPDAPRRRLSHTIAAATAAFSDSAAPLRGIVT